MAAPTTLAAMQQEINSTNLTDGQQIKQLLLDIVTFVGTSGSVPAATTTTIGGVKEAADVAATANTNGAAAGASIVDVTATPTQATINANFSYVAAQINAILTSIKAAGQMA